MVGIGEIHLHFAGRQLHGVGLPGYAGVKLHFLAPGPSPVGTPFHAQSVVLGKTLVALYRTIGRKGKDVSVVQYYGIGCGIGARIRLSARIYYIPGLENPAAAGPVHTIGRKCAIAVPAYAGTLVEEDIASVGELLDPGIMKVPVAKLGLTQFHDSPVIGLQLVAVLLQMGIGAVIPVKLFDGMYMHLLSEKRRSGQKAENTYTELFHHLSFTDSHSPG